MSVFEIEMSSSQCERLSGLLVLHTKSGVLDRGVRKEYLLDTLINLS